MIYCNDYYFFQTLLMNVIKGEHDAHLSSGYFSVSVKDRQRMKAISFGISSLYFAETDVSHYHA